MSIREMRGSKMYLLNSRDSCSSKKTYASIRVIRGKNPMKITQETLAHLTAQAKASERLRMSLDLRTASDDQSQRMLNAVEPGTPLPIHRHRTSAETVVIVRGRLIERFYDDDGTLTEEILMEVGGECPVLQIPVGQWHGIEVLESGTVIFEAKDGAYAPLTEEDLMK